MIGRRRLLGWLARGAVALPFAVPLIQRGADLANRLLPTGSVTWGRFAFVPRTRVTRSDVMAWDLFRIGTTGAERISSYPMAVVLPVGHSPSWSYVRDAAISLFRFGFIR